MFKKIVGVVAVGALGVGLYYGMAFSTPGSGTTTTLSPVTGTFDELDIKHNGEARVTLRTKEDVDIVTAQATFAPGGHTGWHSHPGVVLVTVNQGALTLYKAPDCQPQVYYAGEGFAEKDPVVHILRNEGAVDAKLTVTYIVPVGTGAARRIDEPQPAEDHCP